MLESAVSYRNKMFEKRWKKMAKDTLLDKITVYIMKATDKELQSLLDLIKTQQLVNKKRKNICKPCNAKWQKDFKELTTTGDASEEYLKHLDICPKCQNELEKLFQKQSKALEALARDINKKS